MNWNKFLQIELNWDTWACWFAQSSKTDFDPPMKKLHNRTDAKCIHVKKRLKDVFFPEKHFSCFDLDIMISMCILSLEKGKQISMIFLCVLCNLGSLRTLIWNTQLSFDVQNIFCLENLFEFIRNLKSSFEIWKLNLNLNHF